VVIVRTLEVAQNADENNIDAGDPPDFYTRIIVDGYVFVDAAQMNKVRIQPSWTTIKFVPADQKEVRIRYSLWDEDEGGFSATDNLIDDEECDVNPRAAERSLTFTFDMTSHACSGDVTGVHDSEPTAVTSSGAKPDTERATVRFYVTARRIQ
jgi:hypothetical protein